MRWILTAALLCACKTPDVDELRADTAELRSELREIREELRQIRAEQRELRELAGGEAPKDPEPAAAIDAGAAAPELPPTDASAPKQADIKIAIRSNPGGAAVWLGDRKLGYTPLLYSHPPGTETLMLRIEKPGYRPRLMSIRPDEDAKISVQLAPKEK